VVVNEVAGTPAVGETVTVALAPALSRFAPAGLTL
jgi:hypothetical protein